MERTSGSRIQAAVTFRSYLPAMVHFSIRFRWAFNPSPSCLMERASGCRTETRIRFPDLVFTNPLFLRFTKGTKPGSFVPFVLHGGAHMIQVRKWRLGVVRLITLFACLVVKAQEFRFKNRSVLDYYSLSNFL